MGPVLLALAIGAIVASALQRPYFDRRSTQAVLQGGEANPGQSSQQPVKTNKTWSYLDENSKKFAVNSTGLPHVHFDIGESYAGLLSITDDDEDPRKLFFWFFPSSDPKASKEIVIWLQGGPGCSSMVGLLQENGPFLWQPGVYEPFPNPYSWTNLTNVVWVDQPFGIGLSQGNTKVRDDAEAAQQFLGFWKNFVDVFSLYGYKVYIAGESYGGRWVPYLAGAMLDQTDMVYYNVDGVHLIDAVFGNFDLWVNVPLIPFVRSYNNILHLNDSFIDYISDKASGYIDYYNSHVDDYPPKGPLPPLPYNTSFGDDIFAEIMEAVIYINPCFSFYHITQTCPFPWNQLSLIDYAAGPNSYFSDPAVQSALHVPQTNYSICGGGKGLLYNNDVPDSSLGPLPGVIERTNNVIIANGALDMGGMVNGSLLCIQNMTWNGQQGFQTRPSADPNLFVPYHWGLEEILDGNVPVPMTHTAGAGLLGKWQEERGLTFVEVFTAGHMLPQTAPGASYRIMERLLGRITRLDASGEYTT
ncbi:putative Carboxypeptidase [Seiridium cardinale]